MSSSRPWLVCLVVATVIGGASPSAAFQEVRVVPSGGPTPPPGTVVKPGQPGQPGQPGGQPTPGAKPGESKPGEEAKKPDAPTAPPAVTRPPTPKSDADRQELAAKLGPDGRAQLNFHGQKWLDVLEWYAAVAGMSLDWQEVPGDYLNLRTQRSYNVDEIRDLLNRHLMDRGYTLLKNGEVLIVVNLKKLDPALVPRVAPEDLPNRDPHEFVKTSFKLDWLIAESTVEELKPMLSPNGKIWGMKATNRIEALDAAANLAELYRVLKDEQSGHGQERLVREFKLQYTRADDVYELLLGLLGKEKPKKETGPMDPRQMMQMQQMMQQMQQQGRPGGDPNAKKAPSEIHLVVNRRENSVLASGPPDLVALCEQAVKTLDVPREEGSSLLANSQRMQIYRMMSIDPEPLVETLKEIGNLDPETQLRVDKKGKAIIAYAPLADHITIRAVVDKLDGTDRRFEVVKLRRLEADYVANTIQFMLGEAEQKQSSNRSSYYYNPFDFGSGGSSGESESRKFRIEADVEHNRLLIWANDVEFGEIEKLLIKLGELPPAGSRGSTLRTVDSIPLEDAAEVLKRLQQAWPGLGGNPLQLNIKPKPVEPRPDTAPVKPPRDDATSTQIDPPLGQPSLLRFTRASVSRTTDEADPQSVNDDDTNESDADEDTKKSDVAETATEAAAPPTDDVAQSEPAPLPPRGSRSRPPVTVELDPSGRWILKSDDPEALDRMEDLLAELAPPRRDYKLFQLKYNSSWAYSIALTLEDFFKEKEEKPSGGRFFYYDYGSSSQTKKDAPRLSKRRALKFIADTDSNSILVVGADPGQLRIIEELIEYYDQPVASDAKQIRRTQVFQVKYSQARVIAEAVKDVYRDLLSENDKALQQPNGGQNGNNNQQRTERTVTYVYDNFGDSSSGSGKKGDPPQPVRFKGALSIGVDEVSNSLVISSTEMLINDIKMMIETLDQAARPNVPTMQVLQVGRHVPAAIVQEKLSKMLKEQKKPPQQPQQQPNGQPRQPNQAQQVESDDGP
jgi:type II secretory pathway component GspD/PulD (secretin)